MSTADGDAAALAALARQAGAVAVTAPSARTLPAIVFRVGARWCAAHAADVREVVIKDTITRVPTAPAQVRGLALVRGRLVPVITVGGILGAERAGPPTMTLPRLIVLASGDLELGIVADEARGPVELPETQAALERATPATPWRDELPWREHMCLLLDVPALLERVLIGAAGLERAAIGGELA